MYRLFMIFVVGSFQLTHLVCGGAGSREGLLGGCPDAHEGPGDGAQGSDFSIVSSPGSGSARVISVPDPLGLILEELE